MSNSEQGWSTSGINRRRSPRVIIEDLEGRELMSVVPLATPASLLATAKNPTSVQLSWSDKDAAAQGYNILRSSNGGDFTQVGQVTSGKTTSFLDATASEDTTYTYRVQSYNTGNLSSFSNATLATTPLIPPSALTAAAQSRTGITLNWTDNDSNAAGYYVFRSSDGVHFTQIATLTSADASSYTDNSVISGRVYTYDVQAYSGSVTSAASNKASASTPLAAPSALGTTVKSSTSVQLTWTDNDSDAAGYNILRSTDGTHFTKIAGVTGAAAATYTDNSVASLHGYTYEVQAYAGSIISPASGTASASTPLTIPTTLTATATGPNSIHLSWADKDGSALGYNILRSTDGVHFNQVGTVTSGKTTTWTDSDVASDTAYSYRIQAYSGQTNSDASNTVTLTTPLETPSSLSATTESRTSVELGWTDNDDTAAGYYVLRASDGVHFSRIGVLSSGDADAYTDNTVVSGHTYTYEIQAYNGSVVSATSANATANTPLAAPSNLTATPSGPTSVLLGWADNDLNAGGYYIYRSLDGVTFTKVGQVASGKAISFTDTTAASAHLYTYEIKAYAGAIISDASNSASATTPLIAPVSLTATMVGSSVNLAWTDKDTSATGYNILRSTDGVTYDTIAQITPGTARTYIDSTVSALQTYYYQVQATASTLHSAVSTAAKITTPLANGGSVSVTTRYGDELVITAAGSDDAITLDESDGDVSIIADGKTTVDAIPAAGLFVYTRGGSDSITIDASVTAPTTLETIDGATTLINSNGSDVSAWIDSTDAFNGLGVVHRIATFLGNTSKALAASLANPSDSGTTTRVNASLWGTGPVMGDVNQGEVGDCYFLSSLAAFANTSPAVLQNSAVDMGDGTYVVQFYKAGQPEYVRVNNAMPAGPFDGFKFANPGASGSIWAMVMEKAFADFRTGANTYASLNSGWMGDVYADLNVSSDFIIPSNYSETNFYNLVSNELNSGKPVTLATNNAPNLVSDHAYTLVSVSIDNNGVTHYVVRNPWGVSGDSLENSQGYATLTFAQLKANFIEGCIAA